MALKNPKKRQPYRNKRHKKGAAFSTVMTPLLTPVLKCLCLIGVVVGVSVLFVFLYNQIVRWDYMKLRQVVIHGVEDSIKEQIVARSGLTSETSLLVLHVNDLKKKIEKHPWVRRAEIKKQYPGVLMIRVEKETPRAVVVMDTLYLMNPWGRIFTRVDQKSPLDYPLITGVEKDRRGLEEELRSVSRILHILEGEAGSWSLDHLSEVHVQGDGSVYLYYSSMPVIHVNTDELDGKMGDLKRVVDHLKHSGQMRLVKEINLIYEEGAAVSYKKNG